MKPSKMITALLALLGFAGCDDIGGMVEYGQPHADFEIKGRVVDEAGNAIRDIKIVVSDADKGAYKGREVGVGITDSYGSYRVSGGWFGDPSLTVAAEDIDGDKNGGDFAGKEQKLKLESDDYVGGDGRWYDGKVTKTADFILTLKPQKDEDE